MKADGRLSDNLRSVLDRLAADGTITRAREPKVGWTWRTRGLGLPTGTAARLLDDLRSDR